MKKIKQGVKEHWITWENAPNKEQENIDQQVRKLNKQNKQKHSALTKWKLKQKTMWSSSMSFLPFIQARH